MFGKKRIPHFHFSFGIKFLLFTSCVRDDVVPLSLPRRFCPAREYTYICTDGIRIIRNHGNWDPFGTVNKFKYTKCVYALAHVCKFERRCGDRERKKHMLKVFPQNFLRWFKRVRKNERTKRETRQQKNHGRSHKECGI